MKITLIAVFICLFRFLSLGQNQVHLNCIIFIDGKLGLSTGYFEYMDLSKKVHTINFEFTIGDLIISATDFQILKNLTSSDSLYLVLNYQTYHDSYYLFRIKIHEPDQLLEDYCVIRVTVLNEKKKKFYYGITSPSFSSTFIKKEYDMFEEY